MLDDRKPEPGASDVARAASIDSVESLEKTRQVLGRDAGAGIRHASWISYSAPCRQRDTVRGVLYLMALSTRFDKICSSARRSARSVRPCGQGPGNQLDRAAACRQSVEPNHVIDELGEIDLVGLRSSFCASMRLSSSKSSTSS